MLEFPSCFGENGVQVSDAAFSSSGARKGAHNSVTCIYKCKLFGKSCLMGILWSKHMMGRYLSVEINDSANQCICKVEVKPSFFHKRRGSKCFETDSGKIEVFWDLSMAKFTSRPEPLEKYYIAVVSNGEMVLLSGDMKKEAFKRTGSICYFCNAVFVSKREHITGKRVFDTKAQFFNNGHIHDLKIECDMNLSENPSLMICIDAKTVIHVKHLHWKFRGNQSILVDGLPVEVYWDINNWLFSSSLGSAVIMFQTSSSTEKPWASPSVMDSSSSSWRCSESFKESVVSGFGFSLILYAWKTE